MAYSVGVAPGAVPGAAGAGPAAPFSTEAAMASSAALAASEAAHMSAKSRPSGDSPAVTAGAVGGARVVRGGAHVRWGGLACGVVWCGVVWRDVVGWGVVWWGGVGCQREGPPGNPGW